MTEPEPRGASDILLDTGALIDDMRGYRHLEVRSHMSVSVVTRTELYGGHERNEPAVEALLGRMSELEVDRNIARMAGRIQRNNGLKMADALIAATALEHRLPLMTRNRRHFERVDGLALHDPPEPQTPDRPHTS